jgi:MFS family permease
LLRAKNIGLADNTAIFLYIIFYIVYSICVVPLGIVSDKVGRKPVLMGGYVLFGITSLGLLVTSGFYGILLFFMIYGICYAMIDGSQRAFVVDLAPQHLKGTTLGIFHTAIGLVALPGGYIAELLWDKVSPEATFGYGLILAIISAVSLVFVR